MSSKDGFKGGGRIVLKTKPGDPSRAEEGQASSAEQNGHRKKRRKTDSLGTSGSNVGDTPAAPKDSKPVLEEPEQGDGTTKIENNATDITAAPDTGNNVSSGKKPMKTMRLNPNGKLRSSPPRDGDSSDCQGALGGSRRTSSRIKARMETVPPTTLTISYGLDKKVRQHLGSVIDDIMAGRTSYSRLKRQKKLPAKQRKTQKKQTHPFFLSKSTQNPETLVDNEEALPTSSCATTEESNAKSALTNPTSLRHIFPNPAKTASTFPVFPPRPRRFDGNEPVHPLWPPRDMVHVREAGTWDYRTTSSPLSYKKAKDRVIFIDETENVLSIRNSCLRESPCGDRKETCAHNILCRPKKCRLTGSKLQRTVIGRLGDGIMTNFGESSRGSNRNYLHPALKKLISSLETATSSFDRGEYEENPWMQKYSPKCAAEVLQAGCEASVLRNWLQNLVVSSVSTATGNPESKQSKSKKENAGRKKKRKKPKDLEGFLASSSDEASVMNELGGSGEDELAGDCTIFSKKSLVKHNEQDPVIKHGVVQRRPTSKAVLLSGASGSGKTAAVYAVANELGFEVFEINSGSRRNAKDLVERVGDMTQNHLVHLLNQVDSDNTDGLATKSELPSEAADSGKQSTMANFFKKKEPSEKQNKPRHKMPHTEIIDAVKDQRSQKQSLILLEEVDVLFSEDKQFWSGVLALIRQSKRPVVMTCNDESLVPLGDIDFHAILRFRRPDRDIATDYLLLLAANEGHLLDRQVVSDLLRVHDGDLRSAIMQLNFWCQMAVGSGKAGLDWIDSQRLCCGGRISNSTPRTVSCNTYSGGIGWYCTDTSIDEPDPLEKKLQLLTEGMAQWGLGLTEWLERRQDPISCEESYGINALEEASYTADMKGVLDLFCQGDNDNLAKVRFASCALSNDNMLMSVAFTGPFVTTHSGQAAFGLHRRAPSSAFRHVAKSLKLIY